MVRHCDGECGNSDCKIAFLEEKVLLLEQVSGMLCDKCGWAMKFPEEPCRCELEQQNKKMRLLLEDTVKQLEDENEKLRFILDEARQVLMSQHDSNDVNAMLHRIHEMIGYEE